MTPKRIAIALAWSVGCGSAHLACADEFRNDFGWEWLITPVEVPAKDELRDGIHQMNEGAVFFVDLTTVGVVRARVVTVGGWQRQGVGEECRAVAFDGKGLRIDADTSSSSSTGTMVLTEWRFLADDEETKNITVVGIEVLRPEGRRKIAARAQDRAKTKGVELLPFPRMDEPFEFSLTSMDGRALRSADLKGKVVLIDCWATWCTPCMAKMPELKLLHESRRDSGLEIIGINFDQDVERAKKAIEGRGLNWAHVHVPDDVDVRRLWYEACTVRTLPRLFLIDREGLLRRDFYPEELTKVVDEALKTAITPRATSERD